MASPLKITDRAKDFAKRKLYNDFFSQVVADNPGIDTKSSSVKLEIDNQFNAYGASAPEAGKTPGGDSRGGIAGAFTSGLESLSQKQSSSFVQGEKTDIKDVVGLLSDLASGKKEVFNTLAKGLGDNVMLALEQQLDLQKELNTEAGITGELSEKFRSSITEAYPSAIRLGYSFKDLTEAITTMTSDIGRFRILNEETLTDVTETSRAFFSSLKDGALAANKFQDISLGARDASLAIQKAGQASLQLGLNAKQTTSTLVYEIGKLNQFGFKNSIDGLNQMIQKAQSLKMNLNSAFTVAEEVMDPSKALEYAAQLQSIGGAFGAFNDPIKLMYDATNNVEDLQESIIGASESLATYNSEQGRFEVTGANLRRAREMAKYLGMDYKELTNLAVNAAQRTSAAADMMATGIVFKNEEDKEFLTNLAQMKDGKMSIEIPKDLQKEFAGATSIALENMTSDQADQLLRFRKEFQGMSTEDIAKKQVGLIENLNRDVNFLAALARMRAGTTAESVIKKLGFDPMAIQKTSTEFTNTVAQGIDGVNKMVNDGVDTLLNVNERDKYKSKPEAQQSVPVAEAEKKAKEEAEKAKSQNQQQQTQPTKVDVNLTSNVDGDTVRRMVLNDPTMIDKFFSEFSYTSLPK